MKSSERQKLKHDEVQETLQDVYARIDQNRSRVIAAVVGVAILAVAIGGWMLFQKQRANKAGALLAEGLVISEAPVVPPAPPAEPGQPTPPTTLPAGSYTSEQAKLEAALPKFMAAAEAYPSTQAGIAARYYAATTLVALGKTGQARQQYQEVIDAAGRSLYGRMARLGVAEIDVKAKNYDAAIASLRELSLDVKGDLPIDAVLVQLGQAYLAAGKKAEAQQAFQRVTTEFAQSPYAADARKRLDGLKAGA